MSNVEANRERLVRSIETRLRGMTLTWAQADRIRTAAAVCAATATDRPADA